MIKFCHGIEPFLHFSLFPLALDAAVDSFADVPPRSLPPIILFFLIACLVPLGDNVSLANEFLWR